MLNKKTKNYKDYLPAILIIALFLLLYTPILYNLKNIKELKESEILEGRSGGGGEISTGSILATTTASYSSLPLVTGSIFLERILIGNSIAGGIIFENATDSNYSAFTSELYSAAVGTHEIGLPMDLGLLVTTSPGLNAGYIYREL